MTILFMGGEMASFLPSSSAPIESASPVRHNASFARCSVSTSTSSSEYFNTITWASQDELYIHGDVIQNSAGTGFNQAIMTLYDVSDGALRLKRYTDGRLEIEYLNASAVWTSADIDTFSEDIQTIDFYCKISTGDAKLYVGGTERLSATGLPLGHITGITGAQFNANYAMHWSQVIVATEPTIGWRLITRYPSGAGATSSWTGTYTDIDEISYSDADFINSGTADQVSTFAQTGPTLTGYTVRAVGVYARARRGAGGPQNLQLALRASGTDYFSGSKALGIGYTPQGHVWETNPATSAAWVNTAIDALQPGVKSIT
jgi:hypothetical protein